LSTPVCCRVGRAARLGRIVADNVSDNRRGQETRSICPFLDKRCCRLPIRLGVVTIAGISAERGEGEMDIGNAQRLLKFIPDDAKVIDVGGGAAPFPRADYVIDSVPFAERGSGSNDNLHEQMGVVPRYSADRWIQADLCDHRPWPIADKAFDFATCSHLLEDVRDPIWICSELRRIAKAGYIEVPSRVVEQSKGVENPCHAGFYHHRWLITKDSNRLDFRHKPHALHSVSNAVIVRLGPRRRINPKYSIVTLDWVDDFAAVEVLEFEERSVIKELCDFAASARRLPDLTVKVHTSLLQMLKRHIYWTRLKMGRWP